MTNRDSLGRILPGQVLNPGGRPKMPFSLDKKLKQRLEEDPSLGDRLIDVTLKLALKPDAKTLEMIWERIDGKVASELAIKGIIVHVGNEYAQLGIESVRKDIEDRKMKYLIEPVVTNTQQNGQDDTQNGAYS